MSEPYLGTIIAYGFNFAPRGWAMCNGQIMAIAQNTALFSLLGTTYGGNGQTTFALPNLQSRVPMHFGQGPGLSAYQLGEVGGTESVTLTPNQMPTHTHPMTTKGKNGPANSRTPVGGVPAIEAAGVTATYSTLAADADMAAGVTAGAGGNQPHGILQPFLALNYCIALEGIFPSRN